VKIIFKYCRAVYSLSKKYFFINVLYTIVISMSWIGINYALKLLTDIIIGQQSGGMNLVVLSVPILLYFVFAILLGGSFYNFEQILLIKFIQKSMKKVVNDFVSTEAKMKHDLFYNNEFHNEYTFAKGNQGKVIELTTLIMNRSLIAVFNIILSAAAILYFDFIIFIYLSLISVISFVLNNYISKQNFKLNKSLVEEGRVIDYYGGLLSNRESSKEIRIFDLNKKLISRWNDRFIPFMGQKIKMEIKGSLFGFIIGVCELIMNYVFVAYLFLLIFTGKIKASDAVFLQGTFWVLSYGINTFIELVSRNILESKRYVTEYDNFLSKYKNEDVSKPEMANDFTSVFSLEFKNVSYKYPGGSSYALKNVNLKINQGEVVSFIGENGSGKSTLSKIVCGLLEDYTGEVLINGVNIKQMNKLDLFRCFGVAFQEFNKYSISLKENIIIGDLKNQNDERYNEVIKYANLSKIIDGLAEKDETILGKEYDSTGTDLSIGQWQRIILGRSYIKNPAVLILDEPTASIDPKEEMRIISTFKDATMKSNMTILITHRIGFSKISDIIYMMKKGEIVEFGSHNELLDKNGEYNNFYYSQKHLYE
jgi:ABC-type bacteriocin/lantibiotic exporters, contain an N-terminal double-glycine peptidase domain